MENKEREEIAEGEPCKVHTKQPLQLVVQCSPKEEDTLSILFQPLLNMVTGCNEILTFSSDVSIDQSAYSKEIVTIPSYGVILFLQEKDIIGSERLKLASKCFSESPWKLHHTESVAKRNVQENPYNNMDYYFINEELPLWAVRQVHTGNEFVRLVQFVSNTTWQDAINLNQLIIGHKPDIIKHDFCLFSFRCFGNTFQFALKKLPQNVTPVTSPNVQLKFVVQNIGNFVPLLPNPCKEICSKLWKTEDLDGNILLLDVSGGQDQNFHSDIKSEKPQTLKKPKKQFHKKLADSFSSTLSPTIGSIHIDKPTGHKKEKVHTFHDHEQDKEQTPRLKLGFVQDSVQKFEHHLSGSTNTSDDSPRKHFPSERKKQVELHSHKHSSQNSDKARKWHNKSHHVTDLTPGMTSLALTNSSRMASRTSSEENSVDINSIKINKNDSDTEMCSPLSNPMDMKSVQRVLPPPLRLQIVSDDEVSVDDSGVSLSPTTTDNGMWRSENSDFISSCSSSENTFTVMPKYSEEEIIDQHKALIQSYFCKGHQNYRSPNKIPRDDTNDRTLEVSSRCRNTENKHDSAIHYYNPVPKVEEHSEYYRKNASYDRYDKEQNPPCHTLANYYENCYEKAELNCDQMNNSASENHRFLESNCLPLKSALKSGKPKTEKPKVTFKLGFFI